MHNALQQTKVTKKKDEIKLLGWNLKTVLINGELKVVWGMSWYPHKVNDILGESCAIP